MRGVRVLNWSRRVATPPDATWSCFLATSWIAGAGFGPRPVIEEPGDADWTGCTRRIGVGTHATRFVIVRYLVALERACRAVPRVAAAALEGATSRKHGDEAS